jgi:hypothetical protein
MDPVYGCEGATNEGVVGLEALSERLLDGLSLNGVNVGLSPNLDERILLTLKGVCAREERLDEGLTEGVDGVCCAPLLLGVREYIVVSAKNFLLLYFKHL